MKKLILFCLGAFLLGGMSAYAQTGTFNTLNLGNPDLSGVFTVPNGTDVNFAVERNYTVDLATPFANSYNVEFFGRPAFTLQNQNGPALALFRPTGTGNNIGQLELGTFGDIFGQSKWLGLGSAPAAAGAAAYGKRIQWNSNFAVFNLREVNSTTRDLVVQWGGTTSNNRLRFEYANSPTASPSTYMQIESDGRVGINGLRPFGGLDDQLYVNGRIGFGSIEYLEDGGGNTITSQASLVPSVNNSRDLGNATFRWDDVFATNGVINTSDRRDKTNIKDAGYGLEEVLNLRPVTYDWKKQPEKGTQFGLIAQEVNEILPEIVYDPAEDMVMNEEGQLVPLEFNEDARMGINYALVTPVLIKAIQEQNEVIESQQARIEELEQNMSKFVQDDNGSLGLLPKLYQNTPNPFEGTTEIGFYLPESVNRAVLYIYDMQGQPVMNERITKRGEGSYTFDGSQVGPGMYLYALIADGVEVDVKRMILTDAR